MNRVGDTLSAAFDVGSFLVGCGIKICGIDIKLNFTGADKSVRPHTSYAA